MTGSRSSSGACSSRTSPPAAPTAAMKVPASMRSDDDRVIERLRAPCPMDVDDVGFRRLDLGTHLVQHAAQLFDLGLAGTVDERGSALGASAAAIIRFSVPPTVGMSKTISAPAQTAWEPRPG